MSDTTASAVPPSNPSSTDLLPRVGSGINYERFLDCVHCGLCTASCPTYLETGNENDSPRGRIYLMRAVTDGRLELTHNVKEHLDLCLDCRSCETACPSGVQYGRLIEPFRVEMQQRAAKLSKSGGSYDWFQQWILYGLFPYPGRLRWALAPAKIMQVLKLDKLAERIGLTKLLPERLQRMQRLLPPLKRRERRLPEFLPAIGPRRARVALFTGCVAEAMFHHVNWATARVLQANGCDVVIPRTQACCGAIHYHSGAGQPALDLARQNANAFGAEDLDAVIVNVAGCGSMLKDYGHLADEVPSNDPHTVPLLEKFAGKIKDISEFLAALGPIAPKGEVRMKATYHDACHLCHAQKIREQPRDLLALVPGLELVPLAESEICCGAAGSYNLTEGEMADRLADRKLKNILATGAETVIMGNAGCSLQIQAALRKAESLIWVAHPMEILDLSYSGQDWHAQAPVKS
ncbi:(Fe-S)-binding protein [Schlesneria paludicola]|uniref:(Fe-S)-binding protein n=1 Tax=Schlesneria paludicola TaxID=360056 RepID=UPI00029AE3A3|nr:heterodisulfide reductase-related iron-sulfur binding cluster [Schlesneria paludicola]